MIQKSLSRQVWALFQNYLREFCNYCEINKLYETFTRAVSFHLQETLFSFHYIIYYMVRRDSLNNSYGKQIWAKFWNKSILFIIILFEDARTK